MKDLLTRAAALVYTLLVVELLLLLTAAPGLLALVLLDHDASNAPLAVACAIPCGPAFSAALFAVRHRSGDLADLTPARTFWRGYRTNAVAVLKLWVPWLVWLAVLATTLTHGAAAGVPGWWRVLLVVLALGSTLWAVDALVITSLFAFRTVDAARLALYFLLRTPGTTVGIAGLLVVAAGVTALSSEAVALLLGSALAVVLLRTCRPMTAAIADRFTA